MLAGGSLAAQGELGLEGEMSESMKVHQNGLDR